MPSNNSPPQYKPPAQIQALLDQKQQQRKEQQQQQATQEATGRRRTAVLPKRSWIQRNPRIFQVGLITASLLVLFSKPLYDAFIADHIPLAPNAERVPPHKR